MLKNDENVAHERTAARYASISYILSEYVCKNITLIIVFQV